MHSIRRLIVFALMAVWLAGCASAGLRDTEALALKQLLPSAHLIEGVPFILQSEGHCGPATLAMVMAWAGKPTSEATLAEQLLTPSLKGSLQSDLVGASRRSGFTALPISGWDALLREVAAGHPVIVFENLGLSWMPQWHYAVVHGYDLDRRELVLHSGPNQSERTSFRDFEASWRLGEHWGLVVLPPNRLGASSGELAHVKAALALEASGHRNAAWMSYRAVLEKWPRSLAAHFGLANLSFEKGDLELATRHLELATQFHPRSAQAWHNLALVRSAKGQEERAQRDARRALELASPAQEPSFKRSLAELVLD